MRARAVPRWRAPRAPVPQRPAVRLAAVLQRPLRELQRDDRVHEALLSPVVEVAHDAPPRFVARADQPRSRGRQLVAAVGVGDRGGHQLGELAEPRLGAGGEGLVPRRQHHHRAPDATLDQDRGRHHAADAAPDSVLADRAAGRRRVVVDPRRAPGPVDPGGAVLAAERVARADGQVVVRVTGGGHDERRRVVARNGTSGSSPRRAARGRPAAIARRRSRPGERRARPASRPAARRPARRRAVARSTRAS